MTTTKHTHTLTAHLLAWLAVLLLAGCDPAATGQHAESPSSSSAPASASAPDTTPPPAEPDQAEPPSASPAADSTDAPATEIQGTLTAHFFDVGQSDATLLAGPDFTILIDAGRHDRQDVVPLLKAAGVQQIDLLIGTHPHADHIGQFPQVLEAFTVAEVWMSGDQHTTRTFERALDAILVSEAGYHEPRAGEVVQIGSARVEVVNPADVTGDFHAGSVSVRIVFGDVAFLFTGDAEVETELAMIGRGHDLKAQVLQLGHHGSRTSSGLEFLRAVDPEVAIYSAGADNSYGHPHAEVVQRLANLEIPLYGTPEHGTIQVITDGRIYGIEAQRRERIRGPPQPQGAPAAAAATQQPAGERGAWININTATPEELTQILHIGADRAQELIRLRPFKSLDQMTRITGIGPARLRDIRAQGLAIVE